MLKLIADSVFSFDVEWIPDPKAAEILHGVSPLGEGSNAKDSFEALWASARKEGDPDDFQPYLKTILLPNRFPGRCFSGENSRQGS